jgi:hypothetical protein
MHSQGSALLALVLLGVYLLSTGRLNRPTQSPARWASRLEGRDIAGLAIEEVRIKRETSQPTTEPVGESTQKA